MKNKILFTFLTMALLVILVNYSKSYAQSVYLKSIEGYEQELSSGKKPTWEINGAYSMYREGLQKLIDSNHPDLLMKEGHRRYDQFAEITDRLIKLMDPIKKKDPVLSRTSWFVAFERTVNSIYEGYEEAINQIKSGEPNEYFYAAYWRLTAIKSYKDSKTKIETMEPKVKEFEALVKKRREKEEALERNLEREKREEETRQRDEMKAKSLAEEREYAKAEKVEKEKYRVKQEEAARRKQAKLAKYNVKAEVSAADLRKNPFQFEGKVILLTGVSFDRMLEKGLAVFEYTTHSAGWVGDLSRGSPVVSSSTEELLVSKVPVDFNKGYADLIVKCKGTTKATNSLGGVITLPLVEYIDTLE